MILLLKDRILRLTIIHSSLLSLIFSTRNYFRPPSKNSMQVKQWYFGFSRDSMAIYPGIGLIAKTTISSRKYGNRNNLVAALARTSRVVLVANCRRHYLK